MRVFLTGATGYMGRVVLEKLLDSGIDVLALARPSSRSAMPTRPGLAWAQGTLDDADAIGKAVRQTDAAMHMAAQHDFHMQKLDWAAITAIGQALEGTGKPFIATSATPVYGHTGDEPRDEHEPVEHPHPLRTFRLQHDRFVIGLRERDVRGVVVRPPLVYGRSGGFLVTLINQAIEDRTARTIGNGTNRWSTVDVDDLADLYVRALLAEDAYGAFNAGSRDVVSMKVIAETIAQSFGPKIPVGSWTEQEACARLGELMALMSLDQHVSSERARSELGWNPRATTLIEDLSHGSYRLAPLVPYSH
ncbi:NAD-dependent epimerase/dehydratase family protein [Paraburkholderia phytofirmans]|nr:NAD-dependent epimerase/dehydratase family protein [Paraburkholderia phytofirmans]